MGTSSLSIAVIVGSQNSAREMDAPFAHIVAMEPGEVLSKRARQCVHVFALDDAFEYAGGVLAVGEKCLELKPHIPWPMLVRALSKPVKAFEGLINIRPGQPPHQRLKNYVEDGFTGHALPEGEDGYAAVGLFLILSWNNWNAEGLTLKDRTVQFHGASKWNSWNQSIRDSKLDLLRKFCAEIGLRAGEDIDVSIQRKALMDQLIQAKAIYAKLYKQ